MEIKEKLALLREKGYELDIKEVLIKGWEMYKTQPFQHISYTLMIITLQLATFFYVPSLNLIMSNLILPALISGFYFVANSISRKETFDVRTYYKGFQYFTPIIFIWILCQVIFVLGLFALVLPGIYLLVAYGLSVPMAIFGGLDVWSAMEESRKLITVQWWKFFQLTLLLLLLNAIGFWIYGLGLVFSIPFTYFVFYAAFEKITAAVFPDDREEN